MLGIVSSCLWRHHVLSSIPHTLKLNLCRFAPWVVQNLVDVVALFHVAIKHMADKINALVTNRVRYTQVAVHDLVNAVEGILLVYNRVEKNAQCPYVLLLSAIWLSSKHFGSGVVCIMLA